MNISCIPFAVTVMTVVSMAPSISEQYTVDPLKFKVTSTSCSVDINGEIEVLEYLRTTRLSTVVSLLLSEPNVNICRLLIVEPFLSCTVHIRPVKFELHVNVVASPRHTDLDDTVECSDQRDDYVLRLTPSIRVYS